MPKSGEFQLGWDGAVTVLVMLLQLPFQEAKRKGLGAFKEL
jgi:hypothetical protein